MRYCQSVDAVVLGMRADELNEGRLPTKIEGDQQTVVSSRDLESDSLAV
jgi:hypothetical protein